MVRISPAARKSKLLSAALKVRMIEPESEPKPLIAVESAPASTAATWLGGAPPDQAIEDTLVLTSLRLKSVKVSTAEDAVSRLPLPVAWGISAVACPPERSAPSTGWRTGGVGGGGLNVGTSMPPGLVAVVMVTANGAGPWF